MAECTTGTTAAGVEDSTPAQHKTWASLCSEYQLVWTGPDWQEVKFWSMKNLLWHILTWIGAADKYEGDGSLYCQKGTVAFCMKHGPGFTPDVPKKRM